MKKLITMIIAVMVMAFSVVPAFADEIVSPVATKPTGPVATNPTGGGKSSDAAVLLPLLSLSLQRKNNQL